jgi:hypothetical protein
MIRDLARIGLVAATALLAACASAPSGGPPAPKPAPVERASEKKPYDFRSEGTVPPLTAADAPNEPDVEERSISESAIDVSDAQAPPDTAQPSPVPSNPPADALVAGFRVQVLASADRDIAQSAARGAQERTGLPSYVDLESGMYKVRVGDFTARADADRALAGIRAHYADAWIVATQVRTPRRP